MQLEYVKINYPDGSFYVKLLNTGNELTFRINSYSDLWLLNQINDTCVYNNIKVDLTIPNLLDAQADKRFNSNESSNLKLVCEFLNNMNFNSISFLHPHNSGVLEAYIPNVKIIDNSQFIQRVLDTFTPKELSNIILLSSDAGGFKPLMKLADKLEWEGEVYGASKSRKYEDGKSKLVQVIDKQDFEGKSILIVDDICVFGGTFIGLAKMLKERNCGKLYLAVSHITVKSPNKDLFQLFDKVFTTNSKGFNYVIDTTAHDKMFGLLPENLEIINLF